MSHDDAILSLDGASVAPRGRALDLDVYPGDRYAVMGPAASGKTALLAIAAGLGKTGQGQVQRTGNAAVAADVEPGRRVTPQRLAKGADSGLAGVVLSALGLLDVQSESVGGLTESQHAACAMIAAMCSGAPLCLIDGHLDRLDPWARESTLDLIVDQSRTGRAFLVATHFPTVAQRLGSLIVLRGGSPRFAGTVEELISRVRPAELTVETSDPSAVATMVEPFAISVQTRPGRLTVTAHGGQALAARLLTEGYGRVRSVVVREPTLDEALLYLP